MSWDITLLVGGNAVLAATAAVLWRLWRIREAAVRRLSQEVRALLEDSSAELKVSEARYRSLNRFLPTGVVRLDEELKAVYVNSRFCELAGISEGQADGEWWQQALHPADRGDVLDRWRRAIRVEGRVEVECRLQHADGRIVWVLCQGGREDGSPPGQFVAVFTDIGKLRRAQEETEARAAQWQALFDHSPDAIYVHDTHGKLLNVNQAAAILHCTTRDDLIGHGVGTVMTWDGGRAPHEADPNDDECDSPGHEASVLEPPAGELEGWALRTDGGRVEIAIRAASTIYEGAAAFLMLARDVSERKRNLIRLRLFESAMLHAHESVAIYEFDPIRYPDLLMPVAVNGAFTRITGYTLEEIRAAGLEVLVAGKQHEPQVSSLRQLLLACKPLNSELELFRKDGGRFWGLFSLVPVSDERGTVTHWVSVMHDVTARKSTEAALQLAKDSAVAANRAKSEFLANVSHEVRTPLTAILGFADIITNTLEHGHGVDPGEVRALVETIRRNGEHLLELLNGILDLSKVEAGKLEIEREPVALPALLGDLFSLMRVRAVQKRLTLELRFDGAIPRTVLSDGTRLRQILINLIGNAIKFTDSGRIEVRVRCERIPPGEAAGGTAERSGGIVGLLPPPGSSVGPGSSSRPKAPPSSSAAAPAIPVERARLGFEVRDTGIGMSPEEVGSLFEPFYQADGSNTRRFGGTGLGLAISRRLTEALGGSIRADSEPGRGSCFVVSLPGDVPVGTEWAERLEEGTVPPPAAVAAAPEVLNLNCRILLAEDGPDNQRAICFFLRKAGATVDVVEDGRAAVDRVHAAAAEGKPFDLVVMDMQMPIMDGYSAVSELRATGHRGPIMALTADAMSGSRERCLEIGCDDFAVKPIQRIRLLRQVASLVHRPVAT